MTGKVWKTLKKHAKIMKNKEKWWTFMDKNHYPQKIFASKKIDSPQKYSLPKKHGFGGQKYKILKYKNSKK